jgi:hypothetical protein
MLRERYIGLVLVLLSLSFFSTKTYSQKRIRGIVTDKQSDEHIPFASIVLKKTGEGTLTDSAGNFTLTYPGSDDSLVITSVGYIPVVYKIPQFTDSTFLTIKMVVAPVSKDAVVKTKFNRALWFWNRIMLHKKEHDIAYYKNYSYEAYNKLEIDLNNVNSEKLEKIKLLKPFNFILKNVDSSEQTPYLPVFLTETISDFYLQHDPKIQKEIIKASNTNGIANESVTKLLGVMYQNVNVYKNYIPVFDRQFISPFHDNAENHYNYKLLDTQYLANKRLVHLRFTPKRKGENTFEGDCWVADSSYAIQKITMRPSGEANVNFVQQLSLIQEYRLIDDTTWFLAKDKFVADVSLLGKATGSFKGRKTTTYRNVLLNSDSIAQVLSTNKKAEEAIVLPNSEDKSRQYWDTSRHEKLSKNEASVYYMIDTIQTLPAFKKYSNAIMFLGTGYKNIGNYQIGPWQNWVSANLQEGTRVRFDLGTNSAFSKKYYLHSYLAYGFGDKQIKGGGDIFYLPQKHPRLYYSLSYFKDIDNGLRYYDEVTSDNIFALAFAKSNIHPRYQMMQEKRFEVFKELSSSLSILGAITSTQYNPVKNLPDISYFTKGISGDPLNSFETSIRLRYAYLETFLENDLFRTSLGSDYPIVELKYTKGWAGILKSSYNYNKVSLSISDYMKLPPNGKVYYNLFAGKVFGTLPFSFLEIHPGNNLYYYNKYAFNLMNRFEFISDKYAGFNVEHNIGNGLFRLIPITRKLKFRQFWQAKGLIGSLSNENQQLNNSAAEKFQTLNNKMYLEVGTGVDNILKFLRVDFIWRVLPQPLPAAKVERFGIFGSFRLSF